MSSDLVCHVLLNRRLFIARQNILDLSPSTKAVLTQYAREDQKASSSPFGIPVRPYILASAACVPDAAQEIVSDRYHATRYVKEEAADPLNLDLVRDNRMPGRGRSV